MRFMALGLSAAMFMGMTSPVTTMAEDFELSDGFGMEAVFEGEENFGGFVNDSFFDSQLDTVCAVSAAGEESSFIEDLEEDIASENKEQPESEDELTSEEEEKKPGYNFDEINKSKAIAKACIFSMIDAAAKADPQFALLAGPLKAIFEMVYNPLGQGAGQPTQLDKHRKT